MDQTNIPNRRISFIVKQTMIKKTQKIIVKGIIKSQLSPFPTENTGYISITSDTSLSNLFFRIADTDCITSLGKLLKWHIIVTIHNVLHS